MGDIDPDPRARRRRSALDGPLARVVALGVFLLAGAALAWMHRDDLFGPEAGAPAEDPVALCVAGRWAGIDAMVEDGVVDAARAAQFKARAEALCRAQHGPGAGPPPVQ
jgi:hypothetical protein